MKISEKQLQQVDKQIQRLLQVNNFYGQKLREAGIKGVSSVEEFQQPRSRISVMLTPWG